MDKNIVSDIKNKMDTYDDLVEGDFVKASECFEEYIGKELAALLVEGAYYTGVGGMDGEWEYIKNNYNTSFSFRNVESTAKWVEEEVAWQDIAGCIEELKRTFNECRFLED